MADTPVETLFKKLRDEKSLRLKESRDDRLKGSFIWHRATRLAAGLSGTALETRVRSEFDQVVAYLDQRLGPKHDTGPLVPQRSGAPDGVPAAPHLDLLDLARQRVSDLQAPPTFPLGRLLKQSALRSTEKRVRFVLVIVWRAAALEDELWSTTDPAFLDAAALDEVLDRRLRTVERMSLNIGSREEMMGRDEFKGLSKEDWGFGASASAGTRLLSCQSRRVCSSHMKMSGSSQLEMSAFGDALSRGSWTDGEGTGHDESQGNRPSGSAPAGA